MIIVGGSASLKLSEAVANILNAPLAKVETKKFPDAETYVCIHDNLEGQDVVLIQNGYPNDKIIELFILQDAIYENGANSLTTVIPYYGYAR
jgi:ribose-phosphate pyrophosphokinase